MDLRDYRTVTDRRLALEKKLGIDLKNIGSFSLDEAIASTRNCENMIGAARVPLGIAGPLSISNIKNQKSKSYHIPLATTEGALIASVSRGCKAITESGGATVDSYRVGATRGAVFEVKNLKENYKLNQFLEDHFGDLQNVAAKTSSHLTLAKFFTQGVGKFRYVRFVFDTQDAMGMNMATIATTSMYQYIESKTGARCVSVAGNYDVDKKPSWLNVIEGRGIKVWAEVVLTEKVIADVLKTTAKKIFDVWLAKCMIGSAMSGSMGFNAHFANVVAAFFLATGQDPAHVAEGNLGITTMQLMDKDLYASIYLPDLMVGTVGGATGLATQREALSILRVGSSEELAEVLGAAVLAGEVSLLASLAEGSLAKAHQRLARGK